MSMCLHEFAQGISLEAPKLLKFLVVGGFIKHSTLSLTTLNWSICQVTVVSVHSN